MIEDFIVLRCVERATKFTDFSACYRTRSRECLGGAIGSAGCSPSDAATESQVCFEDACPYPFRSKTL